MSATEFQMTTATRERSDSQTETASVLHFDMCHKLRKAFADFSAETKRQAEETAKAKRNDDLRAAYVARRPEPSDAA